MAEVIQKAMEKPTRSTVKQIRAPLSQDRRIRAYKAYLQQQHGYRLVDEDETKAFQNIGQLQSEAVRRLKEGMFRK